MHKGKVASISYVTHVKACSSMGHNVRSAITHEIFLHQARKFFFCLPSWSVPPGWGCDRVASRSRRKRQRSRETGAPVADRPNSVVHGSLQTTFFSQFTEYEHQFFSVPHTKNRQLVGHEEIFVELDKKVYWIRMLPCTFDNVFRVRLPR